MNLVLKGVLIGLGKIIPGVSGSMIAISLGIYEDMLYAISNIFKDFSKNTKFLFKIGTGIIIPIIFVSKIIVYLLNNYYLPTMLLFIGLIVGGIPMLIGTVKKEKSKTNVIFMLFPLIFLLLIDIFLGKINIDIELNIFTSVIIGIIDAITMIIPGISGTAVMMMLGVYEDIMVSFSCINKLYILIPFLVGIGLGVLLLSRIISKLLEKYRIKCYYAIIGFVYSSIIILFKQAFTYQFDLIMLMISIVLFILGFLVSYRLK